ncbi:Activating signal cointegrator 1 complex subunit 2 [Sparganum proliferum]
MESPVKSIVSSTRKDKTNSQKYPLLPGATNNELNSWNLQVSSIVSAYSQLLLEDFDKFWCEILHSPTLHASLDSVLQAGPRFLDLPQSLHRFAPLLRQVKTLTLLVFQRASQSKHSNGMFLTDSEYARLVHEKSVFDSHRFISLTSMYFAENREVVTEIIRSVVAVQPKFVGEIITTLQAVLAILRNTEQQLQQWQLEEDHGTETSSDVNCIGRLDSVIDYLLDMALTLDHFLSIVSQACPDVPKKCIADGLHTRFAHYCDSLTDLIRGQVLRNMRWSFEQKASLLRKLSSAIAAMVKTVRCGIVEPGLLNPITQLAFSQDASDTSKRQGFHTAAAEFLQLLTEFTNHRNFACFYSLLYAIDEDINSIQEMAPSDALDPHVLEYVRGAYSALSLDMKSQQANAVRTEKAPPPVSTLLHPQSEQSAEEPQAGSSRSNAFCTVKAVLPDADDDLIQRCLEHYKDDCQAVISGLLEGTVPLEVSNPEEARQHLEEQERRKGQQQQQQQHQQQRPRQDYETATMNLAAAAATGVVTLQRGQIWKGKRQDAGGPALPPLSAQDRERVKQMAVSVWDDDDDDDRAGYSAWWRSGEPGRAGGPNRFEDVNFDPYDGEATSQCGLISFIGDDDVAVVVVVVVVVVDDDDDDDDDDDEGCDRADDFDDEKGCETLISVRCGPGGVVTRLQ